MIDINKIIYTFLFHLTTYLIVLVLGYGLMVLLFSLVKKGDKYGQHLDFKKAIYLIASAIIIYIIFFTSFSWTQHDLFITNIYDLANMEQAIWNTLRGDILRMTTYYPVETRLFFHAEPIFFLLAPLYALWQHPKMLLLLQSIILGLGALPVFLIAYEKLKNTLASLMISLSYLLLPALYQGNIFDFHPLVLAPTFILFAFYFLIKNKNGVSFIFFLLAMMCREEIAFMVFFFGLYIFFFHKKKMGSAVGLYRSQLGTAGPHVHYPRLQSH